MMSGQKPATHEDAQLILRLYELRREEKMRKAREWFSSKFFPQTMEDFKALQAPGAPENAYFRMVTSYWDMAASFLVQGVLNPALFVESGGEMLFVWAKLEEFMPQFRQGFGPHYLANIEKAVAMLPDSAERITNIRRNIERLAKASRES
jgi:hypothetical protein